MTRIEKALEDVAIRKVDTVVVYIRWVGWLIRSLAGFAKIVEQFDKQKASFV